MEVVFRIILTLNYLAWLRQVPALILTQFRCKVVDLLRSGQLQPRGEKMGLTFAGVAFLR